MIFTPKKKAENENGVVPAVSANTPTARHVEVDGEGAWRHLGEYVDRAWQAVAASQCLFDCVDSVDFSKH